jgi:predicted component of type VI protein secretion system
MAQLHFLTGPLAGKRARLKGGRISVGRDPGNSIRLDDDSVAPRHLVLLRDGEGYALQIDAARPPVAVNGRQVVAAKLFDGDLLQIGDIRAQYFTAPAKTAPNPLDFWASQPPEAEQEVISLDDVEDLPPANPSPKRGAECLSPLPASGRGAGGLGSSSLRNPKRGLIALGFLVLMFGGSLFALRKEHWEKSPRHAAAAPPPAREEPKKEPPTTVEVKKE